MQAVPKKHAITETVRTGLLLSAGLLFYACFGIPSLVCVLTLGAITWLGGFLVPRSPKPSLPVTLAILLLLVVWFCQKLSGIFLLGISFYLLQAIGYLLDVRSGTCPAERNPFYLLVFLSFFPISIQGPICRYPDFRAQLLVWNSTPLHSSSRPGGIGRMLWGAFKKLVIADRIGLMTSVLFGQPEYYKGLYVLLALMAYTVQLYMDFTGGIDIALGAARCLGFTLPENFDRPFLARNLAEYWRRWHITLGGWFRDYVFYPLTLSGASFLSANGAVWMATFITWALTGLWHGLEPRFLLWGLLNGAILLCSQPSAKSKKRALKKRPQKRPPQTDSGRRTKLWALLQMTGVFLLTSLLRSLDCYPDIRTAAGQLLSIVTAPVHNIGSGSAQTLGASWPLPGLKFADLILLSICLGIMLMVILIFRLWEKRLAEKTSLAADNDASENAGVNRGFFNLAGRLRQTTSGYLCYCIGCALLLIATLLFGVYGSGYDASGFIYGNFV